MEALVPLFVNGHKLLSPIISGELAEGLRRVTIARAHGYDLVMSFEHPVKKNMDGESLLVSTHRQPLHHAVWEDNMLNLKNFLELDCSYHINLRCEGETPLGAAIRLNRLKIVEMFSGDDRFDFNQICSEQAGLDWYPITLAVHLRKRLLVKQILKVKNLDLNVTTNGKTALELAAKYRHKEPHIYSLLKAATNTRNSEVSENVSTATSMEDINDILQFVEGDVGVGEIKSKSPKKNKPRRMRNKNKNRNTLEQKDQVEDGKKASPDDETEDKNCSKSDDESFSRLISFLTKTIKEKEEAIKAKESDLECPVCLETAGGKIFCCVEQHLVCSQCRPRLKECPQCRQPYPPTPLRHRYAEKYVGELESLQRDLEKLTNELETISVQI